MASHDSPLLISALQHFAYCPRQFALIHVEQVWAENRFTTEGQILHRRVDEGVIEQRPDLRTERGIMVQSEKYQIVGKLDLLEILECDPPVFVPVEYKRGKPKTEDWDRIQLCAQALCIEEMRDVMIDEAAIWYWEVRSREKVHIDSKLRKITVETIQAARSLLDSHCTPPPVDDKKRCRACSLSDLCSPDIFRRDHSGDYIASLFEE